MRVIGGENRGRRLGAPRGRTTRPTADRVRESLFDILGPDVREKRLLDLYAGTGAVGIEALSRGAARAVFVERERQALRALRGNLAALGIARDRARVVAGDALCVLPVLAETELPFDLVFLDPPYADLVVTRTLVALASCPLLSAGAELIVQHVAKTPIPPVTGLRPGRRARLFGETALTFFRAEGYTPSGLRPSAVPTPHSRVE